MWKPHLKTKISDLGLVSNARSKTNDNANE